MLLRRRGRVYSAGARSRLPPLLAGPLRAVPCPSLHCVCLLRPRSPAGIPVRSNRSWARPVSLRRRTATRAPRWERLRTTIPTARRQTRISTARCRCRCPCCRRKASPPPQKRHHSRHRKHRRAAGPGSASAVAPGWDHCAPASSAPATAPAAAAAAARRGGLGRGGDGLSSGGPGLLRCAQRTALTTTARCLFPLMRAMCVLRVQSNLSVRPLSLIHI